MIDLFLNTGDVVLSENKQGPEKKLSGVEQVALIQVLFDKPGKLFGRNSMQYAGH